MLSELLSSELSFYIASNCFLSSTIRWNPSLSHAAFLDVFAPLCPLGPRQNLSRMADWLCLTSGHPISPLTCRHRSVRWGGLETGILAIDHKPSFPGFVIPHPHPLRFLYVLGLPPGSVRTLSTLDTMAGRECTHEMSPQGPKKAV